MAYALLVHSKSKLFVSEHLAQKNPELTILMFAELSSRVEQCSSTQTRHDMLTVLVPWFHNIHLVENSNGSQLVLNNLFYLTCKFGEQLPNQFELLWAILASASSDNLAIICRFLFVMVSFATYEMLSHAKRIVTYMCKVCPKRVVENMVKELECMDSLCAALEKLDDLPYYKFNKTVPSAFQDQKQQQQQQQQQQPQRVLSDDDDEIYGDEDDDDDDDLDEEDEDDEEEVKTREVSLEQSQMTTSDDSTDDESDNSESDEVDDEEDEVDSDDTDCSNKQFKYSVTKAARKSSKAAEGKSFT